MIVVLRQVYRVSNNGWAWQGRRGPENMAKKARSPVPDAAGGSNSLEYKIGTRNSERSSCQW